MRPFLIDALLDDPWARLSLRQALKDSNAVRPRFAGSWDDLLRAIRPSSSVVVVDPDGPGRAADAERGLGLLLESLGARQTVLYTVPRFMSSPAAVALRDAGCNLWLFRGEDDPDKIRSTLATSLAAMLLRVFTEKVRDDIHPTARDLAWAALNAGRVAWSVRDLARTHHVSPRTLRRHFARANLCAPVRFLGWMRLLRVFSMGLVGATSLPHLARDVGYEDPSSLHRLSRTLVGQPLDTLLSGEAVESLAEGVLGCLVAREDLAPPAPRSTG